MVSSAEQDSPSRTASPGSAGDNAGDGSAGDKSVKSEPNEHGDVERKTKDPKDPSRPRRKKARRACHACQRAHLTCGDERPCQRCIKRGLADQCCDGVRKKAKYLHDTPNEAFLPGGMSHFSYMNSLRQHSQQSQEVPFNLSSPVNDVYNQIPPQANGYAVYRPSTSSSTQVTESVVGPQQYAPPTPAGPASFTSPQGQQSMQTLLDAAQQSMSVDQAQPVQDGFGNHFFDANDISKFNFDPSSFNFGNHYGALEFGMLGHMATGAAETPPSDSGTQYNQTFASPVGVAGFAADSPIRGRSFSMGQEKQMTDWQQSTSEMARTDGLRSINPGLEARAHMSKRRPPAAIPINVSHTRDQSGRLTGALTPPATDLPPSQATGSGNGSQEYGRISSTQSSPLLTRVNATLFNGRQPNQQGPYYDPSSVYQLVTESYPYVTSWHHLKVYIITRFCKDDAWAIMKSLANIRPSFIANSKHLSQYDLIFQEQSFQRTIQMFRSFVDDICTPTIICRRTMEVVSVSNEFSVVTGWSREVLLGQEPNLNENITRRGGSGTASGTATATAAIPGTGATSRGGMNTPRLAEATLDTTGRPLFMVELLDDQSAVKFFHDFSRIAFSEPRGRVETRVSLRKYRTKADMANSISNAAKHERGDGADKDSDDQPSSEDYVDCACIWNIKRDCLETPMLVIMNFLPIL